MTAPVRLPSTGRELQVPQKGDHWTASAQLTLLTTYADFINWAGATDSGMWLDVGNAPYVDVCVKWTHGATATTITLIAVIANWLTTDHSAEPTVGRVTPYIPTDINGSTEVFEHEMIFTKTNYTAGSGFSTSTIKYVGGRVEMNSCRALKLMAKTDSVTGAPVATAHVNAAMGT